MTKATVTIVDYGAGNLRSVAKAIEKLGHPVHTTDDPEDVLKANAVIFPGQGASESAMTALHAKGLVGPIKEVIARGVRPSLGSAWACSCCWTPRRKAPRRVWASCPAGLPCCRIMSNGLTWDGTVWLFTKATPFSTRLKAAPTSTLCIATTALPTTRA